jgi:hypothetical protein
MISHSNSRRFKVWAFVLVFLVLISIFGESVPGASAKRKARRPSRSTSVSLTKPPQGSTTRWKNQRESIMVLIDDGKGHLTGEYTTMVGCPEVVGKPQKLFGTTNGSAISFTVNWACSSITSWTGQRVNPDKINTLWLLSVSVSDPEKNFKANSAGSDVFTRIP